MNLHDDRRADNGAHETPSEGAAAIPDVRAFVVSAMKQGWEKARIIDEAVGRGMNRTEASRVIDAAYLEITQKVLKEQCTGGAIQLGALGGLAAAAVGGTAWGLLTIYTGGEFGIVAWALGFVCGYAVVLITGGKKGLPLQITAAVCSILGVAIAKYVYFYDTLVKHIAEVNKDLAESLSVFSMDVLAQFFENIPEIVGGYDILWIVLAVASAWSIPKGMGITLPPQYRMPYSVG